MRYEFVDGSNKDFILLSSMLDSYLNNLAGGEENRAKYIPYNQPDDIECVVLVYNGDSPIGCAGFKKYDNESAEVKRVFIKNGYRGKGISRRLMNFLEDKAKEKGYRSLILETGEPLIEAMGLYSSIGYNVIPNYGQYVNMSDSICMMKKL